MKRVTLGAGSFVTGSAVAGALVDYVSRSAPLAGSVAVEVPVLETSGEVINHTVLLSASTPLEVVDVDGITGDEEDENFPVPDIPSATTAAQPMETAETGADESSRMDLDESF